MTDEVYEQAKKELEEIFEIELPYEVVMIYLALIYGEIDELKSFFKAQTLEDQQNSIFTTEELRTLSYEGKAKISLRKMIWTLISSAIVFFLLKDAIA